MSSIPSPVPWRLRHGAGFWVIAVAFLAAMAFSTVPTPLYPLYQARDGFPTIVVTVVFAAYAVGVVVSLFLAGHVSDWLGRRRVILAALLVSLLSAAIFLLWPDLPGLLVARFVNGLSIGALTATATAHLSELSAASRPERGPGRAALVSTLVNMGGLGLGPLVGGVVATLSPEPLVVPYAVFLVLFVVLGIAVSLVPETVERAEERPAYRPQRVALPASARPAFWAAAISAFGAFGVLGMFTALAPTFLAGTLHETSRLLAGAVPFATFMAGALAQVAVSRLALRRQIVLALVLVTAGLALVALGGALASLPAFVIGGVVAGAGVGILFRSSVATVGALADPASRGEALAALFLVAYAGLAAPALLIGAALLVLPQPVVLVGFAALVVALVLVAGSRMLRPRPADPLGHEVDEHADADRDDDGDADGEERLVA